MRFLSLDSWLEFHLIAMPTKLLLSVIANGTKCFNRGLSSAIHFNKMKPILYYDDVSPPVRSVLMVMKELVIDVDLVYVNLFGRKHLEDDFLKINPMHTVPTLKHDDIILTDSHSILIYICEIFGQNSQLYPSEIKLRAEVLNKLFFNSSLFFRRDSDMMRDVFHNKIKDLSKHATLINECYECLEIFLTKSEFMACDYKTLADFSILGTLSTVDVLLPVKEENWPRLYNWFQTMKTLPYYESENQQGINNLKKYINKYWQDEIKA